MINGNRKTIFFFYLLTWFSVIIVHVAIIFIQGRDSTQLLKDFSNFASATNTDWSANFISFKKLGDLEARVWFANHSNFLAREVQFKMLLPQIIIGCFVLFCSIYSAPSPGLGPVKAVKRLVMNNYNTHSPNSLHFSKGWVKLHSNFRLIQIWIDFWFAFA